MRQRRPAVALGEVLVAVGVVLFLVGLLVLAVGKLRDTSRRTQAAAPANQHCPGPCRFPLPPADGPGGPAAAGGLFSDQAVPGKQPPSLPR